MEAATFIPLYLVHRQLPRSRHLPRVLRYIHMYVLHVVHTQSDTERKQSFRWVILSGYPTNYCSNQVTYYYPLYMYTQQYDHDVIAFDTWWDAPTLSRLYNHWPFSQLELSRVQCLVHRYGLYALTTLTYLEFEYAQSKLHMVHVCSIGVADEDTWL